MKSTNPYEPLAVSGEDRVVDNDTVVRSPGFAAGLQIFVMTIIWAIIVGRSLQNYSGIAIGPGTSDSTVPATIVLNFLVLCWICMRWKIPALLPTVLTILAVAVGFILLPETINGPVFPVPETGFAGFVKLGLLGRTAVVAVSGLAGASTLYWQAAVAFQHKQKTPEIPTNT